VDSDLASTEVPMCPQCSQLHRALNAAHRCYLVALRSEFFKVCTIVAARKQVDMERARLAYVEHKLVCAPKRNRAAADSTLLTDVYSVDNLLSIASQSALQSTQPSLSG
jgi:hypothetical protein